MDWKGIYEKEIKWFTYNISSVERDNKEENDKLCKTFCIFINKEIKVPSSKVEQILTVIKNMFVNHRLQYMEVNWKTHKAHKRLFKNAWALHDSGVIKIEMDYNHRLSSQ